MTKETLIKGVELNGKINKLEELVEDFNVEDLVEIRIKVIFDINNEIKFSSRFSKILPEFITDEVVLSIKEIINNSLEKYKEEFEDLCCCEVAKEEE